LKKEHGKTLSAKKTWLKNGSSTVKRRMKRGSPTKGEQGSLWTSLEIKNPGKMTSKALIQKTESVFLGGGAGELSSPPRKGRSCRREGPTLLNKKKCSRLLSSLRIKNVYAARKKECLC